MRADMFLAHTRQSLAPGLTGKSLIDFFPLACLADTLALHSVGLTLELLLVFHYFSLFGWKDAWYLKYAVVMVACVDVVSVIVVCEWVYIIGIKHWGVSDKSPLSRSMMTLSDIDRHFDPAGVRLSS